ncbi:MAG: histidine kinase [Bacillota bacterium]|nr:histidine kinase [Bacillota bacterium]
MKQKIKFIYYNLKAKNKQMLIMGVMVMVLFSIVFTIVAFLVSTALISQWKRQIMQQLDFSVRKYATQVQENTKVLTSIFLSRSLNQLLKDDLDTLTASEFIETADSVNDYMDALVSSYAYPPSINLYKESNTRYRGFRYGNFSDVSVIEDEDWYRTALENPRTQIAWQIIEELDASGRPAGRYVLSAVLKIKDINTGNHIAIARLIQRIESLMLESKDLFDARDGVLYVFDQKGQRIYASSRDAPMLLFPDNKVSGDSDDPVEASVMLDGKERTVFIQKYDKQGIQFVFLPENSAFYDFSRQLVLFFYLVIIAVIILSLIVLIVSSNILTRRLVILNQAVRSIDKHNLQLATTLSGHDEVGQLSDSFKDILEMVRELIESNRIIERKRYLTELQALEERINPHFLYNTLSSVCSMAMEIEAYDICEILVRTADFYKLSLSHGANNIHIAEEIRILQIYCDICRILFGSRLQIAIHVDPELNSCYTPKLILQPFVENAIAHGLKLSDNEDNLIRVSVYRQGSDVVFHIADNGVGMNQDKIAEVLNQEHASNDHYAIRNIDMRIKLQFGDNYGVAIESKPHEGTDVFIAIPKIDHLEMTVELSKQKSVPPSYN